MPSRHEDLSDAKMAAFVGYGAALDAEGNPVLILSFRRQANSPVLAFLALSMEHARHHAADLLREPINIDHAVRTTGQLPPAPAQPEIS